MSTSKKVGRPTDYTPELADRICAELAEGKSMRTVCAQDGIPNKSTLFRWLREIPEFKDQYETAKEESADCLIDDMLDIADDGRNDYITDTNKNGEEYERLNTEHVQRSRLRIDTRKWLASKLKPKKYGERQTIEHDVSDSLAERIQRANKRGN